MFQYSPINRITAMNALNHEYFKDFIEEIFELIPEKERL